MHQVVKRGRFENEERIRAACEADDQSLLIRLAQLVDLLASYQLVALRLVEAWAPKGKPN
jgi:hypothetical protein